MYVEVRKRLGVANVYVPSDDLTLESSNQLQISKDQNNHKLVLAKNVFEWPNSCDQIGLPVESTYQTILNGELLYRISLEQSLSNSNKLGVTLLVQSPYHQILNENTTKRTPACFSSDFDVNNSIVKLNGEVKYEQEHFYAFCSKCERTLFEMKCNRILPLPSMNWKENSMDWFCACSHSSNIKVNAQASEENGKNKSSDHKCESRGNRSLSAVNLSPRLGDILYTSVFLCLSADNLNDEERERVGNSSKILHCSRCNSELGFNDDITNKASTLTFWDHSVIFSSTEQPKYGSNNKTPISSIRKILEIASEECAKPFILILLKEVQGEKRQVYIKILEMNLSLMMAESISNNKLQLNNVIKVMYCVSTTASEPSNNVDWNTYIGTEMMEATLDSLKKCSIMIPKSQRYQKTLNDSEFTFSYVFDYE